MQATIIRATRQLRREWPNPLAGRWLRQYPQLFDRDDLRLARNQPRNHFSEWLAAIHLFQRNGAYSLIEKYIFQGHPRKSRVLERVLHPKQRTTLGNILQNHRVQPPDLILYSPDYRLRGFAEVKGPGDRIHSRQRASHLAIADALGCEVEIVAVRIED